MQHTGVYAWSYFCKVPKCTSPINTQINKYYTDSRVISLICTRLGVVMATSPGSLGSSVPLVIHLTVLFSHTSRSLAVSLHAVGSRSHTLWCLPRASGGVWRHFHPGHPDARHAPECRRWCPTQSTIPGKMHSVRLPTHQALFFYPQYYKVELQVNLIPPFVLPYYHWLSTSSNMKKGKKRG